MWSYPILIETQDLGTFFSVKRRRIGPTSMASEIIESAILANSRYDDN